MLCILIEAGVIGNAGEEARVYGDLLGYNLLGCAKFQVCAMKRYKKEKERAYTLSGRVTSLIHLIGSLLGTGTDLFIISVTLDPTNDLVANNFYIF